MSYRNVVQDEWPQVSTVQDQCRLMDAICAGIVARKIEKLCEQSKLPEKEGWLFYGPKVIRRVLEQGILWDRMFSALLVMDLEYLKGTTEHFKRLKGNYEATLDFLRDLRQTPGFSEYQTLQWFLSYWD